MEPKKSICSVCGAEVTKPKSYAMPDGTRACRTHPEAQKANADREQKRNEEIHFSQGTSRHNEKPFYDQSPLSEALKLKCWHCEKLGVNEKDMYLRLLINSSKEELFGRTPNLFDLNDPVFQQVRKELNGKVIVKTFPCELPEWKVRQLVKNRAKQDATNMMKMVILCPDCAKEFGFDWGYDKPKLTVEQMENWAVAAQLMKPYFKEIAKKEMEEE